MKKKYYEISLFGQTWRVELRKGEYNIGGGLAIEMITDEGEDFATLTVNLGSAPRRDVRLSTQIIADGRLTSFWRTE